VWITAFKVCQKVLQKAPAQGEFRECLEDTIRQHKPELIAEEYSFDALEIAKRVAGKQVELFTKKIADLARVSHRLCDPDLSTKARLGYQGQDGWGRLLDALPNSIEWSERQPLRFALEIEKDFPLREGHWLSLLEDSLQKETVFVCGDGHIETFGGRLASRGVPSIVVKRQIGVTLEVLKQTLDAMEYLRNRKERVEELSFGQKTRRARCPTHEPHFKHRFMINQAR
jgi:hypothetical protein